jgi:hypothetical protein
MEKPQVITQEDGLVERLHFDAEAERMVVETVYDNSDLLEENAALRADGGMPTMGSKGQRMVLAARVSPGDIVRLRNLGYNLLSSDPSEAHRALVYLRDHEQKFLTTDKKVIADRKVIWQ